MKKQLPIKTPYLFRVVTGMGDAAIDLSETEWDMAENVNFRGDMYSVSDLRRELDTAIGMYGTPLNIDYTTPMDINAALSCLKDRGKIESFEVLIGYVPKESHRQVGDDGETREIEPN